MVEFRPLKLQIHLVVPLPLKRHLAVQAHLGNYFNVYPCVIFVSSYLSNYDFIFSLFFPGVAHLLVGGNLWMALCMFN